MQAGQRATAFSPKTQAIYTAAAQHFVDWEGESGLLSLHGRGLFDILLISPLFCTGPSRRSSTAAVPTITPSGWTPTGTDLRFLLVSPSSTKSVNSFMQEKIQILLLAESFAYAQRRTNNTICNSGERISLCLLFPDPATNVLRIF